MKQSKSNDLDGTLVAGVEGRKLADLQTRVTTALDYHAKYATFSGRQPNIPLSIVAPGSEEEGPSVQRNPGNSLTAASTNLMARANAEQREQIEDMLAHMSGRKALSNLSPTGDGGNLIP